MRTTDVRLAQHIGRGFKFQWLRQGRRRVGDTGAEAILAAKGIQVYDAKEILSRPFERTREIIAPREIEEDVVPLLERKTIPCYIFHDRFSPPGGIAQVQHLTNTVVRPTFPESVLNQIQDNSPEEDSKVREAILHSHLLDSHQEKLPRIIDVINRPGMVLPLDYAMPVRRKNLNLTYQLIVLLEQLFPETALRQLVTKPMVQVTLRHSGKLMQMQQDSAFMLSSTTPLPSPAGEAEVVATEKELIPEIYPFSPFLHCKQSLDYSDEEYDSVATGRAYPHTIFLHMNMPKMPHTEDTFSAITLMKAFSHAAAYAKQWCKIESGNLERPLTVQVVHTNGNKYHVGVFQLNTLNLNGARRNIFWHQPMRGLFGTCDFKAGEGILYGYNPRVFSILKALHVQ